MHCRRTHAYVRTRTLTRPQLHPQTRGRTHNHKHATSTAPNSGAPERCNPTSPPSTEPNDAGRSATIGTELEKGRKLLGLSLCEVRIRVMRVRKTKIGVKQSNKEVRARHEPVTERLLHASRGCARRQCHRSAPTHFATVAAAVAIILTRHSRSARARRLSARSVATTGHADEALRHHRRRMGSSAALAWERCTDQCVGGGRVSAGHSGVARSRLLTRAERARRRWNLPVPVGWNPAPGCRNCQLQLENGPELAQMRRQGAPFTSARMLQSPPVTIRHSQ
jgi:hypothetical protein